VIKELIYEYWESKLPSIKPRNFDFSLLSLDLINDVLGVRRAGKTYLLFFIIRYLLEKKGVNKEGTVYINFENRKLYPLKGEYFNNIIEVLFAQRLLDRFKKIYLFLDEVQNVEGWQRYIRSIYDEFKGRIKIFISGSNAKLLGKEYARLLSGRHISLALLPLSFKEFLGFKEIPFPTKSVLTEKKRSLIKGALDDYIKFGGFPEVVLSAQNEKEKILQQYFSDIITRDVIFKEKIRKNLSVLEELGIYLINNITNLTSFRRLTNLFHSKGTRVSLPTLERYYQLFEDAFLFFSSRIFSYKIKNQFQHPLKTYCVDTGLVSTCGFRFSQDLGRLYENIVAIELKRRKKDIYYWKDYQYHEVDFVIKEGLGVSQLIQVCLNLEDPRVSKREVSALLKASKELKCKDLLIITQDYESEETIKNKKVVFKPLWKWLLYA
jgi:hypothetical protein